MQALLAILHFISCANSTLKISKQESHITFHLPFNNNIEKGHTCVL